MPIANWLVLQAELPLSWGGMLDDIISYHFKYKAKPRECGVLLYTVPY
jgi:hypothetical protein